MNRYQVILTPDLDKACRTVSNDLNMSMEQVLSSVIQLYMEHLTQESYESFANIARVRGYMEKADRNMGNTFSVG